MNLIKHIVVNEDAIVTDTQSMAEGDHGLAFGYKTLDFRVFQKSGQSVTYLFMLSANHQWDSKEFESMTGNLLLKSTIHGDYSIPIDYSDLVSVTEPTDKAKWDMTSISSGLYSEVVAPGGGSTQLHNTDRNHYVDLFTEYELFQKDHSHGRFLTETNLDHPEDYLNQKAHIKRELDLLSKETAEGLYEELHVKWLVNERLKEKICKGPIGSIVEFSETAKVANYENLWPLDGSLITDTRSPFYNQYADDHTGRVTEATVLENQVGVTLGVDGYTLSTWNLPRVEFSFAGNASVSTASDQYMNLTYKSPYNSFNQKINTSTESVLQDNEVTWSIDPDFYSGSSNSDFWEVGSGISGSTHVYPRLLDNSISGHGTRDTEHSHYFTCNQIMNAVKVDARSISSSGNVSGTFKLNSGSEQGAIINKQPTVKVKRYMVIW